MAAVTKNSIILQMALALLFLSDFAQILYINTRQEAAFDIYNGFLVAIFIFADFAGICKLGLESCDNI